MTEALFKRPLLGCPTSLASRLYMAILMLIRQPTPVVPLTSMVLSPLIKNWAGGRQVC